MDEASSRLGYGPMHRALFARPDGSASITLAGLSAMDLPDEPFQGGVGQQLPDFEKAPRWGKSFAPALPCVVE